MGIVEVVIALTKEVFTYLNLKESRKYIDELVDIQTELLEERGRGDNSDDARITYLYKRLALISEAAKSELVKAAGSK